MAKVGYIYNVPHCDGIENDKEWMRQYGCIQIVEEASELEASRPGWKQLIASLDSGDELVLSKFSNAIRGTRELATLLEMCRIKVIRLISINDKIDSKGILFPETTVSQVLEMFGSIPEEVASLRRTSTHVQKLQKNLTAAKALKSEPKEDREKTIVSMYNNGHSIDDIWAVSGFKSRSSIFRVLNNNGVTLNRGKFSGPLGKRKDKNNLDQD